MPCLSPPVRSNPVRINNYIAGVFFTVNNNFSKIVVFNFHFLSVIYKLQRDGVVLGFYKTDDRLQGVLVSA